MQYGGLCRGCTGDRCHDAPTATEPAIFKCVSCNGSGCDVCGHRGTFRLEGCPQTYIDDDTRQLISTYGPLLAKGTPPVAGGVLDQCPSFVTACMFMNNEQEYWKAKLMAR